MLRAHHGVPTPHAIPMAGLSDFFLVEAGEVIHNDIYKAWCVKQREKGVVIVLDNGAGIGEPVDWSIMKAAYDELQPTYTVLPDTLYDKQKTLDGAREALSHLPQKHATGYTLVIQGATESDMLDCLDEIINSDLFDMIACIGIPFRMWEGSLNNARAQFVMEHIQPFAGALYKLFHLFGCRYVKDMMLPACDFIDTRFAFKYALKEYSLADTPNVDIIPVFKNPMDMQKSYDEKVVTLADKNARYMNLLRDMATKRYDKLEKEEEDG